MFYIYIIYSKDVDKYYVGQTDNIEERLVFHNSGISKYTSIANDWILVHAESLIQGIKRFEEKMKLKRKKAENILTG